MARGPPASTPRPRPDRAARGDRIVVARPIALSEAVDARGSLPGAHVLAGGTDFMVEVNFGQRRPSDVIALRRVDELRQVEVGDEYVEIGAMTSYRTMEREPLATVFPALATAARTVGSGAIRNVGTIGGNLATASPAGDTLPFLSAMDADVCLTSPRGDRVVSVHNFISGPKQTVLDGDELIRCVRVPRTNGPQEFLKIGPRNAMVIAVASCAVVLDTDRRTMRIGLGSVGPRPVRARAAEEFGTAAMDWDRLHMPDDAIKAAGLLATEASTPITDHRGTAEYRRRSIAVMVQRAIRRSVQR